MNDKPDHKDTGLVPTTDKALTTRSSALIRRGLNALERLKSSVLDMKATKILA